MFDEPAMDDPNRARTGEETTGTDVPPQPRVSVTRRDLLIGATLAGAGALSLTVRPQVHMPMVEADEFASWVPQSFGSWEQVPASGVVLPPPDVMSERLYDNLVTRIYVSPDSPPMMLLLAYNNEQDGVLQVHRPEVCYPVGGFQLSEQRDVRIDAGDRSIPATMFTATGPSRTEQVMYFTRLGSHFPRSWIEQRTAVIDANVAGLIPDGMLYRVSTISKNVPRSLEAMRAFTRDFLTHSDPALRRLMLTGEPG